MIRCERTPLKACVPPLACALLLAMLPAPKVAAATLPAGFTETKLIGNINPTTLEITPDGRVLLCEKSGNIRVYKNGAWLTTPMLTLDADYQEERGLLGLALDPDFKTNGYIYAYYCSKTPAAHNRVSRFKVTGDVAAEETVLIDLPNLIALRSGGWHNGGSLQFGKDGKLYVSVGNNTITANSKSLDIVLGKILRLNPDGSIPTDNPFYATTTGDNRAIWALGLRNPFTTAVNPVTGKYFINDVGDGAFEEVNEGKAGYDYGYPSVEGHAATAPAGLKGPYGDPISNYSHNGACAIAGATFYHPPANTFGPAYLDLYFFSDYCGGWIKSLDASKGNAVATFASGINRPINLKVGPDGSMYYVCRGVRAAGLGPGSAQDNMSTSDGSLYVIKGSAPSTGIAGAGNNGLIALPAGKDDGLTLPPGKRGIRLFDLSGKEVWSFERVPGAEAMRVGLPSGLQKGLYLVKSF